MGWTDLAKKRNDVGGGGASSGGPGKVRAVSAPEDTGSVANKLLLQLARRSRAHDAALYHTYIMKADSEYYKEGKSVISNYERETKGQKGHNKGRPEQYLYGILLYTMFQQMPQTDENYVALNTFLTRFDIPTKFTSEEINYCQLSDTHESNEKRLQIRIGINPDSLACFKALHEVLIADGATYKEGIAPRSGLERKLQAIIDKR